MVAEVCFPSRGRPTARIKSRDSPSRMVLDLGYIDVAGASYRGSEVAASCVPTDSVSRSHETIACHAGSLRLHV